MYAGCLRVSNFILVGTVAGQAVSVGYIQEGDSRSSGNVFTHLVDSIRFSFARKLTALELDTAVVQGLLIFHDSRSVAAQSLFSQPATTSPQTCV